MAEIDITAGAPLVSIIIPVYNSEKYLRGTINSILEQTWEHLEVIIVDDGSTDNSFAIATEFAAPNVKVLRNQHKGAAAARNTGLTAATGNYIQFLDADDLLSKDKIAAQMNLLKATPDKIAVCSTVHFPDGHDPEHFEPSAYEESFLYNTDNPIDFLIRLMGGYDFKASMVQPGAWLVPLSVIEKAGPWNESLSLDDDGEFFARVILASSGIFKSGGRIFYRKFFSSANNLSAKQSAVRLNSRFNAIKLRAQHLFEKDKSEAAQKAIYKQLIELQIRTYGNEPALHQAVSTELKTYPKWNYLPGMGGRLINMVSKLLGWRLAKRLQLLYRK